MDSKEEIAADCLEHVHEKHSFSWGTVSPLFLLSVCMEADCSEILYSQKVIPVYDCKLRPQTHAEIKEDINLEIDLMHTYM